MKTEDGTYELELTFKSFSHASELLKFVKESHLRPVDISGISPDERGFIIFYWTYIKQQP